ncbi:type III restriction enzyme [Pelomyxa schiedti]|nr:type III restriction enzyme [Pelomyxa schiedti]
MSAQPPPSNTGSSPQPQPQPQLQSVSMSPKYYNAESFEYTQNRPARMAQAASPSYQACQQQQQAYQQQPMRVGAYVCCATASPPPSSQMQMQQQQIQRPPQQYAITQSTPPPGATSNVLGGFTSAELACKGYGNSNQDQLDLGKDGAFSDFHVAIFSSFDLQTISNTFEPALRKKGFNLSIFPKNDVAGFIRALKSDKFDVAWVISDSTLCTPSNEFPEAIFNFHRKKRGLMIWGDNAPYFAEANILLPTLCGARLEGNTQGERVMAYGNSCTPGEFCADHPLFAGISYLYEGHTICYPVDTATGLVTWPTSSAHRAPETVGKLQVVATSSNGMPVICCMDRSETGGRLVVDTGFTKLYPNWWVSEGQARYVVNACVFLVDIEGRGL